MWWLGCRPRGVTFLTPNCAFRLVRVLNRSWPHSAISRRVQRVLVCTIGDGPRWAGVQQSRLPALLVEMPLGIVRAALLSYHSCGLTQTCRSHQIESWRAPLNWAIRAPIVCLEIHKKYGPDVKMHFARLNTRRINPICTIVCFVR